MTFTKPDMNDVTDRLAHMLSECHNDSAPMGWEKYRPLANSLLAKFPIAEVVSDERFFEWTFQLGKRPSGG